MLDMCLTQGAGLQGLALQAAPRLMAMASHGNQQGELPLLWSLCSTLVDLGYPVAVLDANATESMHNPGLAQLLDDTSWRDKDRSKSPSWSVIPAALGLQQLGASQPGWEHALATLLQGFGVVLIYARPELLTHLLPDSGMAPLLTVSSAKMSSVTAYQALKQMLLTARLRPTLAAIVSESLADGPAPARTVLECALNFLDCPLEAVAVRTLPSQECLPDDMHRLAWRLLETAVPLHPHPLGRAH